MKKLILPILALSAVACLGTSAFAASWTDLTVNTTTPGYPLLAPTYNVTISENYTGYSGVIAQAGVPSANVYYALPQLTIGAVSGYGVCIDTKQFTGGSAVVQLRKGWESPTQAVGTDHRLNGTVLNQDSWKRATYLFANQGSNLGTWLGSGLGQNKAKAAAFQLAIWDVISGDGSTSGLTGGSNNFTFGTNVTLTGYTNAFVAEAWNGWSNYTGSESALYLHDGQDFLVYAPTSGQPTPDPVVPEIPAGALAPLGLAAFAFIKRKLSK